MHTHACRIRAHSIEHPEACLFATSRPVKLWKTYYKLSTTSIKMFPDANISLPGFATSKSQVSASLGSSRRREPVRRNGNVPLCVVPTCGTHAPALTDTHTHTHIHTDTGTDTDTHTHTNPETRTATCTYTHTPTHTHTHAHTLTCAALKQRKILSSQQQSCKSLT